MMSHETVEKALDVASSVAEIDDLVVQIDARLAANKAKLVKMNGSIETMLLLLAQARHGVSEAEQNQDDIRESRLKLMEWRRHLIGDSV
jgi:hypothetical protein